MGTRFPINMERRRSDMRPFKTKLFFIDHYHPILSSDSQPFFDYSLYGAIDEYEWAINSDLWTSNDVLYKFNKMI